MTALDHPMRPQPHGGALKTGSTPNTGVPDIFVPSTPRHLKITQTMAEDFIIDPAMGAKVIFGEVMDEFQKSRLKTYWWVPRTMDSSGFSSFKSRTFWIAFNMRCLLIPNHVAGVYYQNFNQGQNVFWQYYDVFRRRSTIYRAQIGKMNCDMSDTEGKGTKKNPSCWNCYYKNDSHLMLPAPGFLTDSRNQAGIRLNDLGIDEWTKIDASGSTGIDDQLLGRCTREAYNQHHPFWCNHQLFLATAEDTLHPAYARYLAFKREVDKGNPDYSVISYNYKDMSDRPMYHGRSFKETLREVKTLKDMKAKQARSKFRREGLGLWSINGTSWYSEESLNAAVALGKKRGLEPMVTRHDVPNDNYQDSEQVRYFLGADPAKGDGKKSDDGALMVLRAVPIIPEPIDVQDYKLDFVWAYKVKRADASQWSAIIHQKDRHFKFSGICLDHGGGGIWIKPELAKQRQLIHDQPVEVTPIVTPDDHTVVSGNHSLIMFSHGDDSIRKKWETLKGADNLIDAGHCEFSEALERNLIGFPAPIGEVYKAKQDTWSEEKIWANRLLDLCRKQLMQITALTDDQGGYIFTKNNAHQFEAKGKKDFAYAAIHAYVRFLVWLKHSDLEWQVKDEDAALCE